MYYDRVKGKVMPYILRWQGQIFKPTKLGYHHTVFEGRTLMHYFHVTDNAMAFKLKLNTETLTWTLIEVSDGHAS